VKRRRWFGGAVVAVVALTTWSACNAVLGIDKLELQSLDASVSGLDAGSSSEDAGATDTTVDRRESGARNESGGDDHASVLASGIREGGGDEHASIEGGIGDGGGDDQTTGLESGSVEGGGADVDSASCASGQACTPEKACQIGLTACDGGLQQCIATSSAKDGTQCDDAGSVCSSGACAVCKAGLDCSEAGSCQKMQISCAMGPQCTAQGNQPNGTSCGQNLYCNGGTCAQCTSGGSCSPTGYPCHKGTVSCTGGAIVCTDTMANADDGTPCGTNQVCEAGACVACTSGASCTPIGNVCQTGTTSCTTGQQTCLAIGNVTNGALCDDGDACTQTDSCLNGTCIGSSLVVCAASDQCHTAGTCDTSTGKCSNPPGVNGTMCDDHNACTRTDSCQGGTCTGANPVVCTASDQCHVAGTCDPSTGNCSNPAATNGIGCNDGNACTTGDQCNGGTCAGTPVSCPAPDACHGAGTCGGGTCGNYPPLTGPSCGTNMVCSSGSCIACTQGGACNPPGNTCQSGTYECGSGMPVCSHLVSAQPGAPCSGGNCCGGTCVNTTSDSNACGTSCKVCPAGSTCQSSACSVLVGTPSISPCVNTTLTGNILEVQKISLSAQITVTALGVEGNHPATGLQGVLALYADSGGAPGALKTYTGQNPIAAGDNRFGVLAGATLPAGSYWIGGVYSSGFSICGDSSGSNPLAYVSSTFPNTPNQFGTANMTTGADFAYYAVGTE